MARGDGRMMTQTTCTPHNSQFLHRHLCSAFKHVRFSRAPDPSPQNVNLHPCSSWLVVASHTPGGKEQGESELVWRYEEFVNK